MLERVEGVLADAQDRVEAVLRPALERPDAGQELDEAEGLREVVVGAGVEPLDARLHLAPGREHQDRRPVPLGPQAAQELEAVEAREHDVEDDEVVGPARGPLEPVRPGLRDVDPVALGLEATLDEPGDLGVALDDEDPHGPVSWPHGNVWPPRSQ